jgi:hypothetical protein
MDSFFLIRGATALTNLGRLSSRRWQSKKPQHAFHRRGIKAGDPVHPGIYVVSIPRLQIYFLHHHVSITRSSFSHGNVQLEIMLTSWAGSLHIANL